MIRQRGPKTARKELTPRVRSMAEGLHLTGLSYRKIQAYINNKENLNVSVSTIHDAVKMAPERDNNQSAPRGPKRKTDERTDRHIFVESRRNRRQPLAELQQTIAPTVHDGISIRTISRRLQEYRIKKWLATSKPLLTLELKAARLA
jgi:transposase